MPIGYQNLDHQVFRLDRIANLNIVPHVHRHIEIVYMLDGELTMGVDSCERVLGPGDVAFCFPNSVHRFTTRTEWLAYILIIDISLTGDFAKKLLTHLPQYPFVSKENVHPEVSSCLHTMYAQYQRFYNMEDDIDYSKQAMKGYIQVLVARLLAMMELAPAGDASETNLTKNLLAYIVKNFKNNGLSLKGMADDLGVSAPYLSSIFSKKIGINYTDFLNSYRIRHAQQQIKNTTMHIIDIAYESGFKDVRTFNRVFKKITGLTPSAYKKSTS